MAGTTRQWLNYSIIYERAYMASDSEPRKCFQTKGPTSYTLWSKKHQHRCL